jgi:transposase
MQCKKIFDGRKLSRDSKEQLRIVSVRRVMSGESPEAVAKGMGLNRRTIYRWLEAHYYGGEDALKAKPIPGAPPKINARQMEALARIVREKSPLQLKFSYALWTLAMIRELIRQKFSVNLSEVSVGRLMRRLGFSPQRPLYRAWQQNPALVENWRDEGVSKDRRSRQTRGRCRLLCRRICNQIRLSRRNHMVPDGKDARGRGDRRAI